MIEALGIEKRFEDKQILQGVDVVYEPGKTNLVIGRSGSGKTVLLKIIAGLVRPEAGRLLFEGQPFLELPFRQQRQIQQKIGMIFQGGALFDSLSVEENVIFPLRMERQLPDRLAARIAQECLERVELPEVAKLYPADLSGGMRKRVAIARAIASKPQFLLCDEPNSGLDPQTGLVIDALIHRLTHEMGITTIVNTHDMNSVMAIGDTVTFLHEGQVQWRGTKEEILHTGNETLNAFVFATPIAQLLQQRTNRP